ncbi:MAG TPA: hypothetical protein VFS05_14810 [Gemmatimonadaceae bacterium]|nr:hypothetical protein [Gemmatimonadaceae bacterium]
MASDRAPPSRLVAAWERDPTCRLCGGAIPSPDEAALWLDSPGPDGWRYAVVHRTCGDVAEAADPLRPVPTVLPAR